MNAIPPTLSPLDRPLSVTTFPNRFASRKVHIQRTFRELATLIKKTTAPTKAELPLLKLATFGDLATDKGSLRHDRNVLTVSGIEADYDLGKMTIPEAVERLTSAGVASMIYTTASHTVAEPRWRILCPTSADLPPTARLGLTATLNGVFGGVLAEESFTLSQAYHYGSVAKNPDHHVELIDGRYIDLALELAGGGIGRNTTATRTGGISFTPGPVDEAKLLGQIVSGESYHVAAIQLMGKWAVDGVPLLEARARVVAAMEAVAEPKRDVRWQGRFDDLNRCVLGIYGKEATKRDAIEPVTADRRPLHRELPPSPDFPMPALGELRRAAEAVHLLTKAPLAMCAQSVLAATTLAAQAHYDVDLPGAGVRPLTGIFVSIASSGERKSAVDRHALKPVHDLEREWGATVEIEREQHANQNEAWKDAREKAKTRCKGDMAALVNAFEGIGPTPKPPASPMLLVADPTPEALVMHLAVNRPWGGLFTAEGALLIGGAAFNDESRMRTGALLNTLWDGDPIRRTRVGTGTQYLPGRRCSVHVMLQPVAADLLLGNSMLDGIGTLARALVVAPESTAGTRFYTEPNSVTLAAHSEYCARLAALLRRDLQTRDGNPEALDPRVLPLHPDARTMWIGFHDQTERSQAVGEVYAPIQAFASKLAEHAGRLAAILSVYENPDALEVSREAMANGIVLAQHYASEMLRLKGGAGVAPDLALASRLLGWWEARPDPRLYLSQIYQRGLNAISDAATARRIVAVLVEHGYAQALPPGTEIDGAARKEAWRLIP